MLQQKLLGRLPTSHKDAEHKLYELISRPYAGTDETILNKNLTNALIYVNTIVFTLKHSYMFQPSRGYPQGVLIHFMSQVNNIHGQM
jgi:hypothetical protein